MTEAILAGHRIQRVAVVGTGVIGASWAAYFLFHGLSVAATYPTPQGKQTLYNLIERVCSSNVVRISLKGDAFRNGEKSSIAFCRSHREIVCAQSQRWQTKAIGQ